MGHTVEWGTVFSQPDIGPVALPDVVISSSRGDRQDVINKTNLPNSPLSKPTTSLAYFMWFRGAGAPPCTLGI